VLAAYQRDGARFLERLHGGFAVAIIDTERNTALLAIDRMGIERIAYAFPASGLAFSSSAETLARLEDDAPRVRLQSVYNYVFGHMVPGPETIFEGVSKLPPATLARYENGTFTLETYWRPRFTESRGASFDELRAELHESLQAGVAACEPDEHTGAFLSGGLDSSSVAGMLSKVRGGPADTFSIGFGIDAYNEMRYARIANEHFKNRAHEYNVTADDIVSVFERIAAAYDEPFGNSSAVPTLFCAKFAAEHGMKRLLAGDGGDEIFGGNERYAKQRVFEAYFNVPAWLRGGLIEPLVGLIPPEFGFAPLRKARSYVDQARVRLPGRLESWNFVFRTKPEHLFEPAFLAAVDPQGPLRQMQAVYDAAPANSSLNRLLYYDWQYTLADNDLRKVGTMCELAGIEVFYPMLDTRVVELSNRVPPGMKMRGLELRSFYKQAMRGFLPEAILTKSKHGFGLPFGEWLKSHARLGELIYGHLSDLKTRRIVQPKFIDDLIAQHRDGHPSYFGYPIWDLAMLEAWFKSHTVAV
jgi:asparagine synthase (glutamine-hydrolysing)